MTIVKVNRAETINQNPIHVIWLRPMSSVVHARLINILILWATHSRAFIPITILPSSSAHLIHPFPVCLDWNEKIDFKSN